MFIVEGIGTTNEGVLLKSSTQISPFSPLLPFLQSNYGKSLCCAYMRVCVLLEWYSDGTVLKLNNSSLVDRQFIRNLGPDRHGLFH